MTRKIPRLLLMLVSLSVPLLAQLPSRPEAAKEPLRPEWCKQLPRSGYATLGRVSTDSAWFEVYRIRPGVFAIYEPHQYEEVISYLITGSKRALLFDTGIGIGDMRALVSKLTNLPIEVLNSHTHVDHIGDDWQFDHILGVQSAYTQLNAQGASQEQVREMVLPERLCGNVPAGFDVQTHSIPAFKISHFVKDGDKIDLGDRRLEVLLTPGHTPDSLCLFDRKNKLLFTGDTFYPGPIFLYVPDTDVAAYTRSVERLAKLAPQLDLLLPSHNFPEAKPEMLVLLREAFQKTQSGSATSVANGDLREYKFDGFSLLMAK